MSMIRYSPLRKLIQQNSNIETQNGKSKIPIEITETDNRYTIDAELPGFSSDEIEITINKDFILIEAEYNEIEEEEPSEEINTIYSERSRNGHYRKLHFGKEINPKEASSTLKRGILSISLPKAEKEKPVKLTPQVNDQ